MADEDCIVPGWGLGPSAISPWATVVTPGGNLPTVGDFDVYCVGPCGPMSVFDSYIEVQEFVAVDQLSIVPTVLDFRMKSGEDVADTTARVFVDKAMPSSWTLDITVKFPSLPADFTNLGNSHCYIGNANDNGYCAGLFFSLQGIAYTGSTRYHPGTGALLLNSTFQVLPASLGLVLEDVYYTLRIAVDSVTQTTFIYITETSQLLLTGHQLRFLLPSIPSASCVVTPEDGTTISVKGTLLSATILDLDSLCVAAGVLIPNLPPIADAGNDQAARMCSVVQLDGSRSSDPEGASLSYAWRLIDGPETSSNVVACHDGMTYVPSPYTNRIHSETLSDFHASQGIAVGDVIFLDNVVYDISSVGTDGNGFYAQVTSFSIPAGLMNRNFKLLRQNAISQKNTVKPTFYPDVTGLYKFELVVFDGQLYSPPAIMVVNVVESAVARGIVPDMSFLWSHLSDFWKLVDGKEIIGTFWSALAQVTASEVLTLWQHEYGKSLRDIQRTFQRKWLHYDLFLMDPLLEQSTVRPIFGGALSDSFSGPVTVTGKTIEVTSSVTGPFQVFLQGTTLGAGDLALALQEQLQKAVQKAIKEQLKNLPAQEQAQQQLKKQHLLFTVDVHNDGPGYFKLLVRAPFDFSLTAGTLGVFTYPVSNDLPRGTLGAGVGTNTYWVERRIGEIGIQEGDYLVLEDTAYRILRVATDPSDPWGYQRLTLIDNLPTVVPKTWEIVGPTESKYVDFYNALVSRGDTAVYEVVDSQSNDPLYVAARVLTATNFRDQVLLLTEAQALYPYKADPSRYTVFFHSVYRHHYLPVSPLVVEVPTLQERLVGAPEEEILRQNIDYFVEEYRGTFCLRFMSSTALDQPDVWQHEAPPKRMWAELTYLDNRPTIEANFGLPASFTLDDLAQLPDTTDYLSVVRGLWYTYFTGPTIYNLRVGTQILLGLPFAEEKGTITEIRTDFSDKFGRILVQDATSTEIVRSYSYPRILELEVNPATGVAYAVGDSIPQFSPLVKGVDVIDYVKDPKWFEGYLNQGSFFEVEKFFKFVVRIDSPAFSLSSLLFVRSFILRIKPTYTFPLFVVSRPVSQTDVDTTDSIAFAGTLRLYDMAQEAKGPGGRVDDPDPSGGGLQTRVDDGAPTYTTVPSSYPNPSPVIPWGVDRSYVSPEDFIYGRVAITLGAPALPVVDSIYVVDGSLASGLGIFGRAMLPSIPPTPDGIPLGETVIAASNSSITDLFIEMQSTWEVASRDVTFDVLVNDVVVHTENVTLAAGFSDLQHIVVPAISISTSDEVRVHLYPQTSGDVVFSWATLAIKLGVATIWAVDTLLPAGTYTNDKLM